MICYDVDKVAQHKKIRKLCPVQTKNPLRFCGSGLFKRILNRPMVHFQGVIPGFVQNRLQL